LQIDIAESIRETLAEFNPVGLYGIGTLSLNHIPASFGEQRRTLLPPYMQLHFKESNSSNTHLFNWLQEKYEISQKDAESVFKAFCEKLLNALVNYGKVNITGIVSFYQSDNKSLEFIPDKDFTDLFYKGLPEIPALHIDKSERTIQTDSNLTGLKETEDNDHSSLEFDISPEIEKVNDNEEKNVKNDLTSQIEKSAEIDLDSDYEESFEILRNDFISESVEPEPKVVPIDKLNLTINEANKQTINESFDSNATWDPTPVNTDHASDSLFNGRNIALVIGLLLLALLGYFGCKKYLDTSDPVEPNGINTIQNEIPVMSHQDSLDNNLIQIEPTYKGVALPERCAIVTGAFKKSRNAIRMQDRLLTEGYDVFQSVEDGLTRVGFKFDCRDVDLEEYLQNIRKTISEKAWYLDPSLYVEYEI